MNDLVVPRKTLEDQRRAADPGVSAWVSANAGAGKTKVLADRVLRLLLAGTDPSRLLCLTFTKAAAANMANRVFAELGRWVGLDDTGLADVLTRLEGERPSRQKLEAARQLFARAVETPGGLKIETIHAFCERILHLFPFEANVPARFEVLDDTASADLLARARAEVMAAAALGTDPALAEALAVVAAQTGDDGIAEAIAAALKEKDFLRRHARRPEDLAAVMKALAGALGLAPGETATGIERAMLEEGLPPAEWPAIAARLRTGKATDETRAGDLAAAAAAADHSARLALYRAVFFTREGTPRSDRAFVTKAVDEGLAARLRDERDRLAALDERLKAAAAVARTAALLTLAQAVFTRVEALKNARGALDFDDLIARTVALLERADAAWVLYKLDAGVDHVLVDEAQDTNPQQWAILKRLTEEFTAGEGAGIKARTLFAVGDPKQSIYGFQGAEPREFEGSGRHFRDRSRQAGLAFDEISLTLSFRSAAEVLSAVDTVFADPAHFKGLSFESGAMGTVHQSARLTAPGLVELWETVRPSERAEPEAWVLPLDEPEASAPSVRLAQRIARTVRHWTTSGEESGRRVPPSDILVLVRKRGGFFEAVIRALKTAGVPVAGADRLRLGEHIAVLDLLAAGRAALLPDDDLTLAAALKSPLVGLTDEDLVRLAARRPEGQGLAAALGERVAEDAAAARAVAALDSWRALAGRGGPFAFYATLLGPGGGRRALVSRLGAEAGDAIDEFLSQALAFERRRIPSLSAFLLDFARTEIEVKRDMDAARDEVRVMTVHGAKGLEAPVVILADGCEAPNGRNDPPLLPLALGRGEEATKVPVWSPRQDFDPPAVAAERDVLRERAAEEHNRLLYVAMTRARDRLVVASYTNLGRDKDDMPKPLPQMCWSQMIRRSLEAATPGLVEGTDVCGAPVWRWHDPGKAPCAAESPPAAPVAAVAEPDWLHAPVFAEPEAAPPLRPSSALGAADAVARPGDGPFVAEARRIGTLVHALVEHLPGVPPEGRAAAALAYVAARGARLAGEQQARIVADALALLAEPELAALFGPAGRAEVPIAGTLALPGGEVPVSGQIDRLAVLAEAVLVADFKTTAAAPCDVADLRREHVAQLSAYRALLMQLYPDRPVRAFLVFTAGPRVFEIAPDVLDEALLALAGRRPALP
ncbi:double-strand break repair helicase AddA [Chelatococcus sp. SYSU_G07232]|uniref:DNA 3'-5' helicase n=1 Tax=Chelatococcus albus TaxID=3047466 RepID=A0ABT7AHP0_9HYPH|nr:double-strand break repair helicase AddA [Chelatococcus sp. SYSU_G07232]MDJ1158900.1 double-strand break repair helicase AddA [Chelatococcus sp. SYSU_G07232]